MKRDVDNGDKSPAHAVFGKIMVVYEGDLIVSIYYAL